MDINLYRNSSARLPGSTAQGEEHGETAGTGQVSGSTRTPQLTTKGFLGRQREKRQSVRKSRRFAYNSAPYREKAGLAARWQNP